MHNRLLYQLLIKTQCFMSAFVLHFSAVLGSLALCDQHLHRNLPN